MLPFPSIPAPSACASTLPLSRADKGRQTRRARPAPASRTACTTPSSRARSSRPCAREHGFVETAEFGANLYGTSKAAVAAVADRGPHVRAGRRDGGPSPRSPPPSAFWFSGLTGGGDKGVKQLRESGLDARFLFLAPPSLAELERRLRARATDGEAAVARRLESAGREMAFAEGNVHVGGPVYDRVVVNDELDEAYAEVEAFCLAGVEGPA